MVALAVVLTFLGVSLLVLALVSIGVSAQRSPTRLLRERFTVPREPTSTIRLFRDDTLSSLPFLHRWLSRVPFARRLERYLSQADLSQRVGMLIGVVLLSGIVGGLLIQGLTSSRLWAALGVGAFGSLPLLYVRRRRRLRLSRYAEQLPDALDVLTRSLQAGQSFLQGVQTVVREMPEPAQTEFRMTSEQLRLGRTLREALQAHADRVENLDFNLLATALLIQREVGGNLTEILENTSRTIRERFKLLGQIQALSAPQRLTGQIIAVLPFAVGAMVYFLNRNFILVLFREEIGRTLVTLALTLELIGIYVVKRIVTIKI